MAFEAGGGKSSKVLRFHSESFNKKLRKMGFTAGMTDAEIRAMKKKISAKNTRKKKALK
jgi:hypothetical protein